MPTPDTGAHTQQEASPPHLPELDAPTVGGGVLTAVFSFVSGLMWMRRKFTRDNTEMAKDKAETSIIATLQAERDKAMAAAEEAWKTRTNDAKLIGELSAKVTHLTELNEVLRIEIHELRMELQEMRKFLCSSDCPKRYPRVPEVT